MSKWVVDIHGDIEGDYEIIKKYEVAIADILDKIESYTEHIRNTGMGKKKSLEFIEKYIEGLRRCDAL